MKYFTFPLKKNFFSFVRAWKSQNFHVVFFCKKMFLHFMRLENPSFLCNFAVQYSYFIVTCICIVFTTLVCEFPILQ
jgi:hypothetical protein